MAERIVSKEDKIKMFEMRLDGKTLQQIGDAYGISRERVRQILDFGKVDRRTSIEKMIYPNIARWMRDNNENPTHIAKLIAVTPSIFIDFLQGKRDMRFSVGTIKQLEQIMEMQFDELFVEK